MKKGILFFLLGCIGLSTEVFFTAARINMSSQEINWALEGHSYVWMFPIYGSAAFLFPILMRLVKGFHFVLRLMAYAFGILTLEFGAGALLDAFTGSCPWEYKTGFHVMGYIRLDYFFFWALFGYVLEKIINFYNHYMPDQFSR